MSAFTKPLLVSPLGDGRRWELRDDLSYDVGYEGSPERIAVPAGFITDFASIPRLFWPVIGHPMGRYAQAAVIHDWMYADDYDRSYADSVFLEAMGVLGVGWVRRHIMWLAVRLFGWLAYQTHRKEKE